MTQSIVDRCIQERFYEFLVHILPCGLPTDPRQFRKRKSIHSSDESGNSFLSAALPSSPIILNASPAPGDDKESGRNFNLNNSNNPLIKTLLGLKGGVTGSRSGTPSPVAFTSSKQGSSGTLLAFPQAKVPAYELPKIGRPPKLGRPRSKSTTSSTTDGKKRQPPRGRSRSGEAPVIITPLPSQHLQPSPVNTNTNNSNEFSPNTLLSISQHCLLHPMPVTPPKNPYEDPNQISDPKTLKYLQLH